MRMGCDWKDTFTNILSKCVLEANWKPLKLATRPCLKQALPLNSTVENSERECQQPCTAVSALLSLVSMAQLKGFSLMGEVNKGKSVMLVRMWLGRWIGDHSILIRLMVTCITAAEPITHILGSRNSQGELVSLLGSFRMYTVLVLKNSNPRSFD